MNEVFRAAAELRDVCDGQGWRYCLAELKEAPDILRRLEERRRDLDV